MKLFPSKFWDFSTIADGVSVRTQIKNAIVDAIAALDKVGHVARPDQRSQISQEDIYKVTSDGKTYVELGVGGDEPEQNHSTLIRKTFPILALCHLPDAMPEGVSADEYADELYAEIIALLEDEADPSVGTWGGLAEQSRDLGGGGIGNDPDGMGTLVTLIHFEVVYRHTRGDLEAAR